MHDDNTGTLTSSPEIALVRSLSFDETISAAEHFVVTNGLSKYTELFIKAVEHVDKGSSPDLSSGTTATEAAAFRDEKDRKWKQPWSMYLIVLMCALGAVEQGMAQTSMNGANLYFPKELGVGSESPVDNFVVGLINSGIYVSVGVFGAWLASPVNARLGRRGAILAGSIICIVANVASASSPSWQFLLFCRFILGAGLGLDISSLNVLVAETAPTQIRGGLAVAWQMFVALGVFLGFVSNATVYDMQSPWRIQLALPAIPAIPLALLILRCPESPIWLIKQKSDWNRAFESLKRLRNTDLEAATEIYTAYSQSDQSVEVQAEIPFLRRLSQLFSKPRIRRATTAAFVVQLAQQLCGINIIAFYSSSIFVDAGFSAYQALIASIIFGLVNFLGAFPAVWTMDRLGRRSLLLWTLPSMAITMFAAGLTYYLPEDSSARFILLASLIYLFCAEYSPGMGPVPVPYSAEVFPQSHRDIGMSFAISVANLWASVLSFTFPRLLALLQPRGVFTLYAGLNVLAWMLVFLFVPETRMKTLEELDEVFSIPARRFVGLNLRDMLPEVIVEHLNHSSTSTYLRDEPRTVQEPLLASE